MSSRWLGGCGHCRANCLRVPKNLGLFTLSTSLCLELASFLHGLGSGLFLLVINSRVDQLHVSIAFRDPAVRSCRLTRVAIIVTGWARRGCITMSGSRGSIVQNEGAIAMRRRSASTSASRIGYPSWVRVRMTRHVVRLMGGRLIRLCSLSFVSIDLACNGAV